MTEFIIDRTVKPTPQQLVLGTMGITMQQLVNAILENRDGRFDSLYKKEAKNRKAPPPEGPTPARAG
ncbi:MAG: hypothetical protein LUH48_05815 [Clostridiales bacterium]|nr:hypothetical protein [Clostridiales bacterium]